MHDQRPPNALLTMLSKYSCLRGQLEIHGTELGFTEVGNEDDSLLFDIYLAGK
jgi:hypothetical protein